MKSKFYFFYFAILFSFTSNSFAHSETETAMLLNDDWEKLQKKGIEYYDNYEVDNAYNAFSEAYNIAKANTANENQYYSLGFIAKIQREKFSSKSFNEEQLLNTHQTLLKVTKNAFGKKTINYSNALFHLAKAYQTISPKKYRNKIRELYMQALTIRKKVVGKDLGYANILISIGNYYYYEGFDEDEKINNENFDYSYTAFKESLEILKNILGVNHPFYDREYRHFTDIFIEKDIIIKDKAFDYHNLDNSKNFKKVELSFEAYASKNDILNSSLYLCTSKYLDKVLDEDTEYYSAASKDLAHYNYQYFIDFHKQWLAISIHNQKVVEFLYSKNHQYNMFALKNIAYLYNQLKNHKKSIEYLNKCKIIYEAQEDYGEEYIKTLQSLSSAHLYNGSYFKSIDINLKALALQEKYFSKNSDDYKNTVIELATLFIDVGNYEKAIRLLQKNKENLKATSKYSIYYNSFLGLAYLKKGAYLKALDFFNNSLKEYESTLPKDIDNHHITNVMMYIGDSYFETKDYENAILSYKKSLNTLNALHGNAEYNINLTFKMAKTYFQLENMHEAQRLIEKNVSQFKDELSINHPRYLRAIKLLSQQNFKQNNIQELIKNCEELVENINSQVNKSFALSTETQKKSFLKNVIGNSFDLIESFNYLYKGKNDKLLQMSLNNSLSNKSLLLNSSKNIIPKLESLKIKSIDLLIEKFRQKKADVGIYKLKQSNNQNVLEEIDSLYKIESELVKEYEKQFDETIKIIKDWRAIKPNDDELAIEFSSFNLFENGVWTDKTIYVAYILKKGWQKPKMEILFEESKLKTIITSKNINSTYRTRGSKATSKLNNGSLYNLTFKPLEKYTEGVNTIYFSPAGLLNKISFSALSNNGSYINEKYNLIQLSNLEIKQQLFKKQNSDNALLIGGINYDYNQKEITNYKNETSKLSILNKPNNTVDKWNFLPGTLREVNNIKSIFQNNKKTSTVISSYDATETSFKNLNNNSPKVIHIATHGFFFENPKTTQNTIVETNSDVIYKQHEDPLLRSGLILSGANYAWQNGVNPHEEEDGILTALEISNLNLSNTDLVVLSACETGLGDIEGSEGVYGLQRAFKMAGVDLIIMSLWEVPDKETSEFMTSFYTNWLSGQNIRTAFRNTQLELSSTYKDNPEKWAAFVLFE